MTLTYVSGATTDDVVLVVAVWERVPFDRYPLPPRPDHLAPLKPLAPCEPATQAIYLSSDPGDPSRPVSTTLRRSGAVYLWWQRQAPGILHLSFDGREVATDTAWSYNNAGLVMDSVKDGPTGLVTVAVTPEKVTGGWRLMLTQGPFAECARMDGTGYFNGI